MKQILVHSPRLDTIIMVENAIKKYSGEAGKFQLWRKLPRAVQYQTYLIILKYLEHSNKIAFDSESKISWIFQPKLYKSYRDRNDLGACKEDQL